MAICITKIFKRSSHDDCVVVVYDPNKGIKSVVHYGSEITPGFIGIILHRSEGIPVVAEGSLDVKVLGVRDFNTELAIKVPEGCKVWISKAIYDLGGVFKANTWSEAYKEVEGFGESPEYFANFLEVRFPLTSRFLDKVEAAVSELGGGKIFRL